MRCKTKKVRVAFSPFSSSSNMQYVMTLSCQSAARINLDSILLHIIHQPCLDYSSRPSHKAHLCSLKSVRGLVSACNFQFGRLSVALQGSMMFQEHERPLKATSRLSHGRSGLCGLRLRDWKRLAMQKILILRHKRSCKHQLPKRDMML